MDSTVGGLDELAEKIRQYKLKQILGVDDFSILIWKHPQKHGHERPAISF